MQGHGYDRRASGPRAPGRRQASRSGHAGGLGPRLHRATTTEVILALSFEAGALFGAHLLLMGLALTAAVLEWTRERLGEALAVPTLLLAIALTLIDVVNGIWYFAPFLGIMTLFAIFGLVDRFMARDEARHQPHVV